MAEPTRLDEAHKQAPVPDLLERPGPAGKLARAKEQLWNLSLASQHYEKWLDRLLLLGLLVTAVMSAYIFFVAR